jgi:hypothetical protein
MRQSWIMFTRLVIAGLVPAIHALLVARKTWMPGTRPGMTADMPGGEHPV